LPWLIGALLAAAVWVQAIVSSRVAGVPSVAVYTLLPCAVLAVTLTVSLRRGKWVEVGALMLAITPTVWSSAANSERHGAIAVLGACGAVWAVDWVGPSGARARLAVWSGAATAAAGAAAIWVASGTARQGHAPSWTVITSRTGDMVRGAVAAVGEDGTLIVGAAELAWWCGVGLLIGAAVVSGRGRLACLVPASIVLFVLIGWAVERWRGPVPAAGGAWLLSVPVALVGARVRLDRLPEQRIGRAVVLVAGGVWAAALVEQVKTAATDSSVTGGDWRFWDGWHIPTTSVPPGLLLLLALAVPLTLTGLVWAMTLSPRLPRGVNVVGYFTASSGLGERARELAADLSAAGVRVNVCNVDTIESATIDYADLPDDGAVTLDTTIAVVTAAQLPGLAASHQQVITGTRKLIGYWFWELEDVPPEQHYAIDLVDEIWAPTRFVRDAYRAATGKPVRLAPLPIPQPIFDPVERSALGLERDEFTFLVSFDHLSVMERKNPLGAIDAFRCAFPNGDEPVALLVKTINGERRPEASARLAAAVSADPRVRTWDEQLPRGRHMALIDAVDVLVTLHRSEGLGLHAADAMWLGTPVLATRYSGNLDFMDDECAALVDMSLVPIRFGDDAYPAEAMWAEPDIEQAAALMRRLVEDSGYRAALVRRARERMETQPSESDAGRSLARLLSGSVTAVGRGTMNPAG
jgi:glycosyltransferase involved in cell wall biosynthesis